MVDALENNDGWFNSDDLVIKIPQDRKYGRETITIGREYKTISLVVGLNDLEIFKSARKFMMSKNVNIIDKDIVKGFLKCRIDEELQLSLEDNQPKMAKIVGFEYSKNPKVKGNCNPIMIDYSVKVRIINLHLESKKISLLPIHEDLFKRLALENTKRREKMNHQNRMTDLISHLNRLKGIKQEIPNVEPEVALDLLAKYMSENAVQLETPNIDSFTLKRDILYTITDTGVAQKWIIERPDHSKPISRVRLLRTSKLASPGFESHNISSGLRMVLVSSYNKASEISEFHLLDDNLKPLSRFEMIGSKLTIRSCITLVANLPIALILDSDYDVIVFRVYSAKLSLMKCRFVTKDVSPMPQCWHMIELPYEHVNNERSEYDYGND